jgi:O-antigen/teichoic acid export membrane protein
MIKLFENRIYRPLIRSYLNNEFLKKFTTVLSVDILVRASGFVLLPLFLRLMTQEEFGLYNYLLSIIQTFSLVLNLGLYIPQSKLYHSYSTHEKRGPLLFTIGVTLCLFLTAVCLPMLLFKWDYILVDILFDTHIAYGNYREIVFLALLISVMSFMLTNFFYTSEKIREIKAYNIYRIIIINIAALAGLYFLPGDAVLVRLALTYVTEFLLFAIFIHYFIKELKPHFDLKLMKKSIGMGFPIMISALFGIVINFSDKFLLQKYGSLEDLSNYYLAFSFASIIPLIFASLQNVWLPVFIKEKNVEHNFRRTKKLISKLVLVFLGLSVLIWVLFVFLVWTSIIPIKYYSVIWILPLLLLTQVFASVSSLLTNYLVYFERTSIASVSGFFVSIVSLSLGLLLIPRWNVFGAAITTLIVSVVYLIIYSFLILHFKKKYVVKY